MLAALAAKLTHFLEGLLPVLRGLAGGVALRAPKMRDNKLSFSHMRGDYSRVVGL